MNTLKNDMKKINALDFLDKKTFTADVYLENGVLAFQEGSEVTPDLLLRAYFKSLYIKDEDERKFLELDKYEDKSQTKEETEPLVFDKELERKISDLSMKFAL